MNLMTRKVLLVATVISLILVLAWLPASARSKADLSRLVVVGDSLSAGYQNGSLLQTQQVHGYANLIAQQARVPLVLPLIASPGVPPVLQLLSVNPLVIAPSTTPIPAMPRVNYTQQATDLAVPGANLADVLNKVPFGGNTQDYVMTDLVLGFPGSLASPPVLMTQAQWAQALKPTTVILWIGNNDALGAATNGSDKVTPVSDFAVSYAELVDELATTNATLVIANVPDVTAIPFFVPVDKVAAELGVPVSLLNAMFGLQEGDYVTLDYVPYVAQLLQTNTAGPLPDQAVLTATEAANVSAAIDQYNSIIASNAQRVGATLVDIHALFAQVKARGYVVDGRRLTVDFLGGIFSLDGVHPTNTGYAVVANEFIRMMNRRLSAGIRPVPVEQVAKTDPLILPGVGHPASAIKKGSLRQMRKMMGHRN
jgi:phospholipase/lecithinase/hemolysin